MSCDVYGQEKVRYTLHITDNNNIQQPDTLDWDMEDTLLNGTDNKQTRIDKVNTDIQDIQYSSKGTYKTVTLFDFDDGWGNIYQNRAEISVEAKVYESPVLDFDWDPVKPTVLEEVTFTQKHDDIRDDTIPKQYGRINKVDVDYYKDGTIDETGLTDSDQFKKTFTTKQNGIEIQLQIEYWDGWETQTSEVTKSMDMTNIPPVSDNTREDLGLCIPNYLWTATSTDIDDAVDELTYKWILSKKKDDDTWEEIETGEENTFTYPFQYEGDYQLILRTTDDDGDSNDKIEEFTVTFSTCGDGNGMGGSGTILLQPNRFQDIAIPVKGKKVKEYFLDVIEQQIGKDVSTVIELVKAFPSSDASEKKYLIYKPGVSEPTDKGNFDLVQTDGAYTEITAFRVRTKSFTDPIEYKWDSKDGS